MEQLFKWTLDLRILLGLCRKVGEDDLGNQYFEKPGSPKRKGRRWVLYKGHPEGSKIPPLWHAWMHYMIDTPPLFLTQYPRKYSWQKPHTPNLSGTRHAYKPVPYGERAKKRGYESWHPTS